MSAGLAVRTPSELQSASSIIAQLAALGTRPSPAGWTQTVLARDVARQLGEAVNAGRIPSQDSASLCGPAAFFYCLLRDRPDTFARSAFELWTSGQTSIGRLALAPSQRVKASWGTAKGARRFLDWMLLASLRYSAGISTPLALASAMRNVIPNGRLFPDPAQRYENPGDELSAITLPDMLADWFNRAGATVVARDTFYLSSSLRRRVRVAAADGIAPVGQAARVMGQTGPAVAASVASAVLSRAPDYAGQLITLRTASHQGWVPLFINHRMLDQSVAASDRAGIAYPDHWIVLRPKSPIMLIGKGANGAPVPMPIERLRSGQDRVGDTPIEDALLSLKVVTWGDENRPLAANMSVGTFFAYYFGSLTAAPFR